MRLPQLFLATTLLAPAALSAYAAPKTPYRQAMAPYVAELNRQCPGRRLQDLTPGDLGLIMEGFTPRLAVAQRHAVEDAVGYRCARIEAGLSCANIASLDTFRRQHVLKAFVAEACATRWTCRADAGCTQAQP